MKKIYCDASFDWNSTNTNGENVVRGKIAIVDDSSHERIEKIAIGKVEGLKQYNNVFELIAIARAIELANEDKDKADSLAIYTDSQVAMYWARAGRIKNASVLTEAHKNTLEYLNRERIKFGGKITFNFIPRDKNLAGKLLEIELKREPPHTV